MLFPFFESKLGLHTMDHNVEQHREFLGGLDDLEVYVTAVQNGTAEYNGKTVIEKLDSFTDTMVQHLREVCCPLFPVPIQLFNQLL
jgi:hypothetical protein